MYESFIGWVYDSGDYECVLCEVLELVGYDELRCEQVEKRSCGELMGIGVVFFIEVVGVGLCKHMDMMGFGMNDGVALCVLPIGIV